ncbi:MAG: DUF6134 family protein [Pseudomonadota bacterium]
MMKRTFSAAAVAAVLGMALGLAPCGTGEAALSVSPFDLYGDRMAFDVLRNGKPVGSHEVRFQRAGNDLVVKSRTEITIKAIVIDLYKFRYSSDANWRDGVLVKLDSNTNDNGKKLRVSARKGNSGTVVDSTAGRESVNGALYPTNHWNPAVLSTSRVLNTITGDVQKVNISQKGSETVQTAQGPVRATRYAYSGELVTEAWYDERGRWVKLRFKGEDGSTIEFQCRQCRS